MFSNFTRVSEKYEVIARLLVALRKTLLQDKHTSKHVCFAIVRRLFTHVVRLRKLTFGRFKFNPFFFIIFQFLIIGVINHRKYESLHLL